MNAMKTTMCVSWTRDEGRERGTEQWCAVKGQLDPEACSDQTMCGKYITLRGGSARRAPTCPECQRILRQSGMKVTKLLFDSKGDPPYRVRRVDFEIYVGRQKYFASGLVKYGTVSLDKLIAEGGVRQSRRKFRDEVETTLQGELRAFVPQIAF